MEENNTNYSKRAYLMAEEVGAKLEQLANYPLSQVKGMRQNQLNISQVVISAGGTDVEVLATTNLKQLVFVFINGYVSALSQANLLLSLNFAGECISEYSVSVSAQECAFSVFGCGYLKAKETGIVLAVAGAEASLTNLNISIVGANCSVSLV